MSGVDGVVFDWGGTLASFVKVDISELWRAAAEHLAAASGRDAAELAAALAAADIEALLRCRDDWESYTLGGVIAVQSVALGLSVAPAVLDEAAGYHLDAWSAVVRHEDDAVATLRQLKEDGLRVGLLSNTHWPAAFHDGLLERDGLAEWIDVRVYTCDMRRTKPDPSAFSAVLERLGVTPDRAVFVGDRARDDVWGAQQVGMRAVWRRHAHVSPLDGVVPDAVIEELSELPAVIAAWT